MSGRLNESLTCASQAATSTYQYDDFGNLVVATLANTSGDWRREYDALGKVVKEAAPSGSISSPVQFTYDLLGRMLEEQAGSAGTVFEFSYDDATSPAPPSGCPTPANTQGRLRSRTDSFGTTYYDYDSVGRLTREIRIRYGVSSCTSSSGTDDPNWTETHSNVNPITTYEYTPNGNLWKITYPHGRFVTYGYGERTDEGNCEGSSEPDPHGRVLEVHGPCFVDSISDTDCQLLEDRGSASLSAGAPYPIDEYIWLGGRPVAFIRSKFDASWARQPDLTGTARATTRRRPAASTSSSRTTSIAPWPSSTPTGRSLAQPTMTHSASRIG